MPRLVVGTKAACAVRKDGTLWCWGTDPSLGGLHAVATQFGTDTDWTNVSLIPGHDRARVDAQGPPQAPFAGGWTCGTKRSGKLVCWSDPAAAGGLGGLQTVGGSANWSDVLLIHTRRR